MLLRAASNSQGGKDNLAQATPSVSQSVDNKSLTTPSGVVSNRGGAMDTKSQANSLVNSVGGSFRCSELPLSGC